MMNGRDFFGGASLRLLETIKKIQDDAYKAGYADGLRDGETNTIEREEIQKNAIECCDV